MDALKRISQETLSDVNRRILKLALAGEATQERLDSFLSSWNIEEAPLTEAIMLSYLMKLHPELRFPESISPRLSGLLPFCRYKYLDLVRYFGTYARALQAHGIEFLVMKGGAMKALRPDFPRWLGDIDILVHEKDYPKCAPIAKLLGFEIHPAKQSTDLYKNGNGVLDVHRFIPMSTGRERAINADLFARSVATRVFNAEARMLSREDLLFGILVNLFRNMADNSSLDSVLYSFFDVQYLLEGPGFNWDIVRQNAAKTGTKAHLVLAARFLNDAVPGLFPEEELENPGNELRKMLIHMYYRRYVLRVEQEALGDFNIIRTFRSGRPMIPYVWDRLCYLMHKGMQFCPSFCERALRKRNYTV